MSALTLGEIADQFHEHPDLPPGRLPNGCWKCFFLCFDVAYITWAWPKLVEFWGWWRRG